MTRRCPFNLPPRWARSPSATSQTALFYDRHRYYDPETGRYISEDPIGFLGGVSQYKYVSSPVMFTDPLGLKDNSEAVTAWKNFVGSKPTNEVHHGLPETLADKFRKLGGADVNNPKHLYDVPKDLHRVKPNGTHTNGNPFGMKWEKAWDKWLDANKSRLRKLGKKRTLPVIERRLRYMAERCGLTKYRSTVVKKSCG